MATVRVLNAERMEEIEATAITYAYLDGNNLILRRHNMEEINLGNVRGPQGLKGDTGEVSEAELTAALVSLLENDRPWHTSWGVLHRSTMSVDMNPVGTSVSDVTSLASASLSDVPAGRLLKCTFSARYSIAAGEAIQVQIANSANTILSGGTGAFWPHVRASQSGFASFFLTGQSGTVTLKPRVSATTGSGRIRGDVETTEFVVEDLGPVPV